MTTPDTAPDPLRPFMNFLREFDAYWNGSPNMPDCLYHQALSLKLSDLRALVREVETLRSEHDEWRRKYVLGPSPFPVGVAATSGEEGEVVAVVAEVPHG